MITISAAAYSLRQCGIGCGHAAEPAAASCRKSDGPSNSAVDRTAVDPLAARCARVKSHLSTTILQDRNSHKRTRLASPATVPIGSELYRSRSGGNPTTNGSAVILATQLELWFACRREDGFEVPCASEHPPARVLCQLIQGLGCHYREGMDPA